MPCKKEYNAKVPIKGTFVFCLQYALQQSLYVWRHDHLMDTRELLHLISRCGHFLHSRRGVRPTQDRILNILLLDEPKSVAELQEILKTKQGSVSELVRKLTAQELVQRTQDPVDRRRVQLRLTDAGRKLAMENREKRTEENRELFSVLTEAEQEMLYELLDRLIRSWEARYDEKLFFRPPWSRRTEDSERRGQC